MATAMISPYRELVQRDNQHGIRLNLHHGQQRAWDSAARYILLLIGSQGGKTVFGCDWLHREICQCGYGDYLAVTATFPLLNLKMLPEFLSLFQDTLHLGTWKDSDKVFLYHNGKTRIIFASATNPESIESATAKGAWLDEAGQHQFRRQSWEAVERRLRINQGRCLLTTTLYQFGGYLKDLYDRALKGDPLIEVIQCDSTANPAFPMVEYQRARDTMPAWKFDLFHRGIYSKPAGMVYDSFDERVCKIARFPIPESWLVYVGHDFGSSNPAAMFYAIDPATGNIYAWQEYKPTQAVTVAEQVAHFKEVCRGRNVIKRLGGSHQEEGWRNDYTAHGWVVSEPKPQFRQVAVRVQRVYALHKLNKVFVFSDLHDYLDEKSRFSYKLSETYSPTDEIEDEASFHLMSSEQYILSDFTPETVVGQNDYAEVVNMRPSRRGQRAEGDYAEVSRYRRR